MIGSRYGVHAFERAGPGLPWSREERIVPSGFSVQPYDLRARVWIAQPVGSVDVLWELDQSSPGAHWTEVARFESPSGTTFSYGAALAFSQGTLLVGAEREDTPVGLSTSSAAAPGNASRGGLRRENTLPGAAGP